MFNLSTSKLLDRYPSLKNCEDDIIKSIELIYNSYKKKGKLLVMGNGGSSADSEHFCGELMKGFLLKRPLSEDEKKLFPQDTDDIPANLQGALPAISLGVAHSGISAFLNDMNPDYIYAQQIWGLGNKEDIIFGISTSGNSRNVVLGLKTAKAKGIPTIALTGSKPSHCLELADVTIRVPEEETFMAQELHLPVYHAICIELEKLFFTS